MSDLILGKLFPLPHSLSILNPFFFFFFGTLLQKNRRQSTEVESFQAFNPVRILHVHIRHKSTTKLYFLSLSKCCNFPHSVVRCVHFDFLKDFLLPLLLWGIFPRELNLTEMIVYSDIICDLWYVPDSGLFYLHGPTAWSETWLARSPINLSNMLLPQLTSFHLAADFTTLLLYESTELWCSNTFSFTDMFKFLLDEIMLISIWHCILNYRGTLKFDQRKNHNILAFLWR